MNAEDEKKLHELYLTHGATPKFYGEACYALGRASMREEAARMFDDDEPMQRGIAAAIRAIKE